MDNPWANNINSIAGNRGDLVMRWGLGGFRPWLFQRVSAVYMLGFLLFFMVIMVSCPPSDYQAWRAWFAHPIMWMATAIFFVGLFLHVWIGLRDVILDYLHSVPVRLVVLVGLGIFLISLILWVFRALFTVVIL